MSDTTTPDPLFTMVYTPTAVVSIEPAAGKVWPGAPKKAETGTQAQLDALRDRLKLAPLPDPALVAAKLAKLAALSASLKATLLAIFAGWTVGEQYDFDGARQAMNSDLEKGDLERAITGVQTFRPGDTSIAQHRSDVLAALTTAAPEFAAVNAAATVAEVNAVGAPAAVPPAS